MIARLLESGPQVLATGGGAFMNEATRAAIKAKGVSIWLSAEFDVLMRRISKRKNERPMLQTDDPDETLRQLLEVREPIYALADLTVQSREGAARSDRCGNRHGARRLPARSRLRRRERTAHDRTRSQRSYDR